MPPTKRKAADAAAEPDTNKKSRVLTQEEKAAARERARLAVMGSAAPKSPPRHTTKKTATTKKKTSSPKRSPPWGGGAAQKKQASVPPREDPTTLPTPPPPSTTRPASTTTLNVEVPQQQALANHLPADWDAPPPPFTTAPSDPLVAAEGDETVQEETTPPTTTPTSTRPRWTPSLVDLLVVVVWFGYFFVNPHGRYHPLWRQVAYQLPVPGNPYRTPDGFLVPATPCYLTNVVDPPIPYRADCAHPDAARYLEPCPAFGTCFGGSLQTCDRNADKAAYLEVSVTGTECILNPASRQVYHRVVEVVNDWTLQQSCQTLEQGSRREEEKTKKRTTLPHSMTYDEQYAALDGADPDKNDDHDTGSEYKAPEPYMYVTLKETRPWTKRPMFALDRLIETDPSLAPLSAQLDNAAESDSSPVEILYTLLEATNPLRHDLKLQLLTTYGANHQTMQTRKVVHDDGQEIEEEYVVDDPPPVQQTHLVATLPTSSSSSGWWSWLSSQVSLEQQCQVRAWRIKWNRWYHAWMASPWLLQAWAISMGLVGTWLIVMHYFLHRAHQQQAFLQQVRDVHVFVLETLERTKRPWEGRELKEYAFQNCPAIRNNDSSSSSMSQEVFYKRLWPKVVFESRTDVSVDKTVLVRSGNLIDVWTWKPPA